MKKIVMLIFLSTTLFSQEVSWKPSEATVARFQLFHSTCALNQPTAETIKQGDLLYGIEHRFNLPVTSGVDNLFGLDGGSTIRMHLGYAFTDNLLVDLARTNRMANYELNIKQRLFEFNDETFPLIVAGNLGVAYCTKGVPEALGSGRKVQPFASLIVNTILAKKIGLGIVPTYLSNTNINDARYTVSKNSFTVGLYAQYFIDDNWAVILEGTPTVTGWRDTYNSYAFGAEFETGGHFFKFIFGNNTAINLSQYNLGSAQKFGLQNLYFGFQITRDL